MELFKVVTVKEAQDLIRRHWHPQRKTEQVPLTGALAKVLAATITSPGDVPGFDRSTVDGFAVLAADTFGASEGLPSYLEVAGEVAMGQAAGIRLKSGQAAQIATGGMLPEGADAVVMLEHTEWLGQTTIAVNRPVAPGENLVRRGEDVASGEEVLAQNHRIRPQDIGILAAVGVEELEVYLPLRVGIISTGNEVVAPGVTPAPGQVRDINSYTLHAMVEDSGGKPALYGIIPDQFAALKASVEKAAAENDLVLISGGSSVGTRDFTVGVLESLGQPGILFHGISLRPGKPTIAAVSGDKLIFGLPGHPASAMVVFDLLVRPLLVCGEYNCFTQRVARAKLSRNLASGAGREDHVRVRFKEVDGELWAEPVLGKSGLISVMVKAEGEIVIPLEQEGLLAGTVVKVQLY
ncbi:molybdenum cofactor biosynthesis protein [Clostridiales bacterium PH28_bin88]|nr:molybdenum cofactor biosynthesis protein [Clostridiales bacterium PH28_bin88]